MQIKSKVLIGIGSIAVLVIATIASNKIISNNASQETSTQPQLCSNQTCFDIEIADTPAKRQYGLMNRTSIPQLSGMLFVFEQEGSYTFWMKDTLIPLDMIRINSGLNIVGILEANPCTTAQCETFNPGPSASYVLELNKGISKKYNLQIGDTVAFKNY